MCSNDPWSCGSRRRHDERGIPYRHPEDQPWRSPRGFLSAPGGQRVWYYKWRSRRPTAAEQRRAELDVKVRIVFETSGRTYGSPRVCAQLRVDGERVSEKTVARSMRTQGLVARQKRRRRGLTRPDKSAPVTADLIRRDFTAQRPNEKWCGDFKQINTLEGPVYLGTVEDLFSRRILGFALSDTYPTAELAQAAVNMAVAIRGGNVRGVIFHTDRGSQPRFKGSSQQCLV